MCGLGKRKQELCWPGGGEQPHRWITRNPSEVEEEEQEGDEHELDIDSTAEGCSGGGGGATAREEPQDQDEGTDERVAWFKVATGELPGSLRR